LGEITWQAVTNINTIVKYFQKKYLKREHNPAKKEKAFLTQSLPQVPVVLVMFFHMLGSLYSTHTVRQENIMWRPDVEENLQCKVESLAHKR
jgi:hypothetical protein